MALRVLVWLSVWAWSLAMGEAKTLRESGSSDPKIAYLLVAHDAPTLDSTQLLLEAIYDEENLYMIHVDAKHKWGSGGAEARMAEFTAGRSNVVWAQLADVRWGGWSMNEPTLWGMRRARESSMAWEIFINLSGDTWPVLTPRATRRTLGEVRHLNFVTSAPSCPTGLRPTGRQEFGDGWHKKQAYPYPMLKEVPGLEAFYGSQWMILSRTFCDYVLRELDTAGTVAHRLRRWFVNGTVKIEGVGRVKPHIPDETFFPTVLMASPFRDSGTPSPVEIVEDVTGPGGEVAMRASFYVRMDEHYPWSSTKQRYKSSQLDKSERPWGPYYLGTYDLGDIRDHRALFVRKTSRHVDPSIFKVLPVDDFGQIPPIYWPKEDLTISKPTKFETINRGDDTGCIRVSESIHCPPVHNLGPDVHESHARAASLRADRGEL